MHLASDNALADTGPPADQQHLGSGRHPGHNSEPVTTTAVSDSRACRRPSQGRCERCGAGDVAGIITISKGHDASYPWKQIGTEPGQGKRPGREPSTSRKPKQMLW